MECPICSQPATKRCTTCKKVSYCSQEHQIEDWKNHKPNCLPYIVTDKTGVKILVLRRDVQKGEIILDEKPLFHIPEYNGTLIDSICAGCGLHMETENIKRCSICRWPVCGTECANSSIHQNFECKHFRSTNFKYKTDMMTISTLMLLQIRARTLKIEHPATWTALNELMTGAMYYHDEWTKANMAQITKFLKKTLPNVDERQRKIITADAKTLRGICVRRGYYMNVQDTLESDELPSPSPSLPSPSPSSSLASPSPSSSLPSSSLPSPSLPSPSSPLPPSASPPPRRFRFRAGYYVYKNASLVKNSCAPNCVWNISHFPDFRIRLRAAVDLKKGQELTVYHLERHTECQMGTIERRARLFDRFNTVCMCERCVDPTELGTYSSAYSCGNCRGEGKPEIEDENLGYLLADNRNALGKTGDVPWRCNLCNKVVQLSEFYDRSERMWQALKEYDRTLFGADEQDALELCTLFIKKYRETYVHPNHWVLQKATLMLIDIGYQNATRNKTNLTESDVMHTMSQCEHMMRIFQKLYPGLAHIKSRLLLSITGLLVCQGQFVMFGSKGKSEKSEYIIYYADQMLANKAELLQFYENDVSLERNGTESEMGKRLSVELTGLSEFAEMVLELLED